MPAEIRIPSTRNVWRLGIETAAQDNRMQCPEQFVHVPWSLSLGLVSRLLEIACSEGQRGQCLESESLAEDFLAQPTGKQKIGGLFPATAQLSDIAQRPYGSGR